MRRSLASAALVVATMLAAACSRGTGHGPPTAAHGPLRTAWRWAAPPPSYAGIPGADGQGVAVTFGHSHVALLDAVGKVRWTVDRARVRDVAPRLTADSVLVATEEGVVALDRASGALRWTAVIGERANAPVVAAGKVVVTTWQGSLMGLDVASGKQAWRLPLGGDALGPAAGDDEAVIATWEAEQGGSAGAVAVDPATGRQRWSAPLAPGGVSAPVLSASPRGGRLVVVAAGDIAAHALTADSGAEQWRAPLEGAGAPEVVPLDAGGGAVLVGHRLGGMALLDLADGRARWTASSDGATVRGGPAGPGRQGQFALPLDDGRVLLGGPGRPARVFDPPGRVSGVAVSPRGELVVATREAAENGLSAFSGW